MKNNSFLAGLFALLLSLALLLPTVGANVQAQGEDPRAEVLALIERMTPEERIGQLFLISFDGVSVSDETQIAALLEQYSVGGVVLRADRGNFALENLSGLQLLISDVQRKNWNASRVDRLDSIRGETIRPVYIPLWLGVSLEEDGSTLERSLTGLSPLPSPMAIGATWEPELAANVGEVLGSELSALGVNMYMGPSLDVLVDPDPANSGDMGTRSFGGSAFWVSQMGKAFIRGLHTGSAGQMLVVAKHFPGRGSADRSPSEEMATVRKTFEELKDVELAPFAAAAAAASAESADALLIAHIRYEGFQGNIRPTTRPLSLDEKSLSQIFTLSPFSEWRAAGGLTISDDLGSHAIRDFYAPGNQDFYANLIARDAFLAGNDLLYMGNILSSDAPDPYITVTRTLDFFAQKYREDPAFAARVDSALIRILAQKLRIYPSFNFYAVNNSQSALADIAQSQQATFEIAQRAATLINPNIDDLDAILPTPPGVQERITFITDTQPASQCALCGAELTLDNTSLSNAVLRLYGLGAGEEVLESNLSMYTFDDLLSMNAGEENVQLKNAIRQADWVVISLASAQKLGSLRQFLGDYQPVLREKKVILFSFTAPYLLDATDISKFTAYYGLYSYAPPFLDVAARLLFKELTPEGASPVDITGVGYDLSVMIEPDPDQRLTLHLALPPEPLAPAPSESESATPAPTLIPMFEVGDTLGVRTGVIRDRNGNTVPDGTIVTFSLFMGGKTAIDQQIKVETIAGTARADFQLSTTGLLDIRIASGEAIVSETLRLDISDEGVAAAVTIIPPVLDGEVTPTPITSLTPSATPSVYVDDGKLRVGAWFFSFFIWLLGTGLAYIAGERTESPRWGIRWALTTLLGGLVAYNYLALSLPGSKSLLAGGMLSVIVFVLLFELLGWLFGWLWLRRTLE